MANLQKTSVESVIATPLAPTAQLQKAWQLLGYQRYLPRQFFQHNSHSSAVPMVAANDIAGNSPVTAISPLQSSGDILRQFDDLAIAVEVSHTVSEMERLPLTCGGYQIVDHQQFTAYFGQDKALWLFPPLWYQEGEWRLFASEKEWLLFEKALLTINARETATQLKTFAMQTFAQSPRYQEMAIELRDWLMAQNRQIICVGSSHQAQVLQTLCPDAKLLIHHCKHPFLARASASAKRDLWLDLLSLKQRSLCI